MILPYRKGRTREVGRCTLKGANIMAVSGLCSRKALVGSGWAILLVGWARVMYLIRMAEITCGCSLKLSNTREQKLGYICMF